MAKFRSKADWQQLPGTLLSAGGLVKAATNLLAYDDDDIEHLKRRVANLTHIVAGLCNVLHEKGVLTAGELLRQVADAAWAFEEANDD